MRLHSKNKFYKLVNRLYAPSSRANLRANGYEAMIDLSARGEIEGQGRLGAYWGRDKTRET